MINVTTVVVILLATMLLFALSQITSYLTKAYGIPNCSKSGEDIIGKRAPICDDPPDDVPDEPRNPPGGGAYYTNTLKLDFNPVVNGFNFENFFKNENQYFAGIPVYTEGRCGGMAYAALDYYLSGKPTPHLTDQEFQGDNIPPDGHPLADYILQRQIDSMSTPSTHKFVALANPLVTDEQLMRWTKEDEFSYLRQQIDDYRKPLVLGLIDEYRALDDAHQVVAYGYLHNPQSGHMEVYTYDPNDKEKESTLVIDPSSSNVDEYADGVLTDYWDGFFTHDYNPKTPPDLESISSNGPYYVNQKTVQTPFEAKVGQAIKIVSEGEVDFGGAVGGIGAPVLDANGDDWETPSDYPAPDLKKNSLIVNIGGKWHQGGTDITFTSVTNGIIQLGVNDNQPDDNTRGWKVYVYSYPNTRIISAVDGEGPIHSGKSVQSDSIKFDFDGIAKDGAAGFQCSLDSLEFSSCTSPKDYSGLSEGGHMFKVKAADSIGNVDPSPAIFSWKIISEETEPEPEPRPCISNTISKTNAADDHFSAPQLMPCKGDQIITAKTNTGSEVIRDTIEVDGEGDDTTEAANGTVGVPANTSISNIDNSNNAPTSIDQSVTAIGGQPVDITLAGNDPDENDQLTSKIIMEPANGILSEIDQNTGIVTYAPNPGFTGIDEFTFKVKDSDGVESNNTGTVTMTVIEGDVNDGTEEDPATGDGDEDDIYDIYLRKKK